MSDDLIRTSVGASMANAFGIAFHPGYAGAFTRGQAQGAYECGSRVIKANSEAGDANPDGSLGTVLGSIKAPSGMSNPAYAGKIMYFVEWDARPKHAIGIIETKLKLGNGDTEQ